MNIHAISAQIQPANQPQKAENKTSTSSTSSVSFSNVFDLVRKSLTGVVAVAEGDQASETDLWKEKLEIEKKRAFHTDLEEAQEILGKIAKLMEKHSHK